MFMAMFAYLEMWFDVSPSWVNIKNCNHDEGVFS